MNIKTFTTTDGENALDFGNTEARYYWCKNIGNTELYVSADANIAAGSDGVAVLPAGEAVMIENYDNFIYVLGTGKIEVYETNTETCPFKLALASESGEGGKILSGSTSYTVTNSVEYPIVGLKVYGKSTQDGTPTPENPVEITSVVEPTVTVCGKNLLSVTHQTTTKNEIIFTNNGNGTYTLNGTATSETIFTIINRLDISGTYRIIGCPPNGSNSTYNISVNVDGKWSVNNYDIGNGSIINPLNYITIAIAIRSGVTCNNLVFKPMITTDLTATYDDFEQYKGNTVTISDTLNAIPVSSGGNVTIDRQEYIADYKDYGTGKYHRLVDPDKLDPTVSIVDNLDLLLASEEITDIPETEMQAYRQLQTYNGTTNISNDKGAGLSVEYCTNKALSDCVMPVTKDLQKQIDDLKAAVLSLGGNV